MTFGDILNQWEKTTVTEYHTKDEAPSAGPHKRAPRHVDIEDEIDLHGLRVDEAVKLLHDFLKSAATRHLSKVLIIHGKGIHSEDGKPVLKDEIRSFLEEHPLAGQFGTPDRDNGGSGATWVMVRQRSR